MCKGWFHHPNTHWLTVRLWLNDIGRKGGDRPAGGNRRGSVRGWPGRSILFVGPLLRAHLLTTCQGRRWYCLTAAVRPPGAVPAGRPFPCPVWDRPADANGGLCIGRSCADHWGLGDHRPPTSCAGYIPGHCLLLLSTPKNDS